VLLVEGAGALLHILDGSVRDDLFRVGTDYDYADLSDGADDGVGQHHGDAPDISALVEMDGGTRIEAFQTLGSAERERMRPLAFETLVHALAGWFKFPRTIARNFDEILPLLCDDIPVKIVTRNFRGTSG
jgi:hypothetical protein